MEGRDDFYKIVITLPRFDRECNHLIADENGRVCEPVEINGITDSGLHFESDSCSVRAAACYTEAAPARSMRQ